MNARSVVTLLVGMSVLFSLLTPVSVPAQGQTIEEAQLAVEAEFLPPYADGPGPFAFGSGFSPSNRLVASQYEVYPYGADLGWWMLWWRSTGGNPRITYPCAVTGDGRLVAEYIQYNYPSAWFQTDAFGVEQSNNLPRPPGYFYPSGSEELLAQEGWAPANRGYIVWDPAETRGGGAEFYGYSLETARWGFISPGVFGWVDHDYGPGGPPLQSWEHWGFTQRSHPLFWFNTSVGVSATIDATPPGGGIGSWERTIYENSPWFDPYLGMDGLANWCSAPYLPNTPGRPPISPPSSGGATVQGQVRNAANGQPLPGATVSAQNRTATTDGDGRYSLTGLTEGVTTVTATAPGFISDEETVRVPAPGQSQNLTLSLTQGIGVGQVRFVLTWGETPHDLDSHLWLGSSHIYYGSPGNQSASPYAGLDTDDTSGSGPETITIDGRATGNCKYAVHNYSGDAPLSSSGARVRVFQGDALIATYTVPQGTGVWWDVVDFPCGTVNLTPVNTIAATQPTPPGGPGGPPRPPPPPPPGPTPTASRPTTGQATLSGQVRHSTTGAGIGGATVQVVGGPSVTTGSDGRFQLAGLNAGPVDLRVTQNGFIEYTERVSVPLSDKVISLSPVLAAGQTQIVLNWGQSPRDLDSYLYPPSGPSINYRSRTGTGMNLDRDDTDGSGPETITITQLATGTYTYRVDQYSSDGSFATSGAVVTVRRGGQQIASFPVPSGGGRCWTVFTMDGTGNVTPVQTIAAARCP